MKPHHTARLRRLLGRITWRAWYQRHPGAGRVPVLCYHRILPELVDDPRRPLYSLTPEQFAVHLAYLAREGYTALTLEEFARAALRGAPLPPRPVMLTFDDGYADSYHLAWPLARRYNVTLNLFLCTGLMGRDGPMLVDCQGFRPLSSGLGPAPLPAAWQAHARAHPHLWRPLTWEEAREMQAAGVGLGFHGHSHRDLGMLAPGEVRAELAKGLGLMETRLGRRPEAFAPPYGGYASLPWGCLEEVRQLGLCLLFTTVFGRPRLPLRGMLIPRLTILPTDDLAAFRRKLAGAEDFWGGVQWLAWRGRAVWARGTGLLRRSGLKG
jgi:peptidoglycan/xylan/chitin deacetylase (PgdA/CDA1 family)